MIIKRVNKLNYTTINNEVVEDAELSYEALGLLTYLLSRPEDWEVHIEQLRVPHGTLRKEKRVKLGKDKIYAIVGELRLAGYMEHKRVYVDGKVDSGYWIVREQPLAEPNQEQNSTCEQLDPGIPDEDQKLNPANLVPANLVPAKPDAYKRLKGTKDGQVTKDSRENARARGVQAESVPTSRLNLRPAEDEPREAAFRRLVQAYPAAANDDEAKARREWGDVDEAEWQEAVDAVPRFLRGRKDIRRTTIVSLEKYIRDRKWRGFPQPAKAASAEPSVELKPFVVPLWAMLWAAIDPAGKNHLPTDKVEYFLSRIAKGLTTPVSALPKDDDATSLIPVKIGSDDHAAWVAHCEKLGVRLPRPDVVPVVYLPSERPPALKATWKGYRLAIPQRLMFRSTAWWYRLHKIEDGTIIEAQLREGGRSQGSILVDMGPWPSSGELASMVEVSRLSDQWRAWAMWFDTKGVYLDLWSESSIWCPSEYPPLSMAITKEFAT